MNITYSREKKNLEKKKSVNENGNRGFEKYRASQTKKRYKKGMRKMRGEGREKEYE